MRALDGARREWGTTVAFRKIAVVMNPGSGKGKAGPDPERVTELLSRDGAVVSIRRIGRDRPVAGLVQEARADGCDIVVAAGGDGTICGVASAMAGGDLPMGVLPLGTFNYFTRSLSIPPELEPACDVVLAANTRTISTARVNDRLFLNNTSIGRYPEILANREGIYRRWGRSRLAAYVSVIRTLMTLRRPLDLTISADGTIHRMRTPLVFVLNNAFQLQQMGLKGQEELAAGKLVMFMSPDAGRFGQVRQALALAAGLAEDGRDFHMLSASRFDIESRRSRHTVALDGERFRADSPLVIRAVDADLRMVLPADYERDVR